MKTTKNLSAKNSFSASAALLMMTSMASVYAEEGEITQTHTLEFTRTELNSPVPGSDFGQKQHQNQYKHTNKYQNKESSSAASSMNSMNSMNHYIQGNTATDFLNRQNTASRSMSGGVIKVF